MTASLTAIPPGIIHVPVTPFTPDNKVDLDAYARVVDFLPYQGSGPAFTDVIAGHVPVMAGNILSALPHTRSGRIRACGVTSAERSSGAPEIPAIAAVHARRARENGVTS